MKPRTVQLQATSEKLAGCNVHKMHITVSRQPNDRGALGGSTIRSPVQLLYFLQPLRLPFSCCIFCTN
jgi:hypothetical protein